MMIGRITGSNFNSSRMRTGVVIMALGGKVKLKIRSG